MPDRVLVQFKSASVVRALPKNRLKSGTTAPSAVLGIPSVDAISSQVRAINAVPAIETPRNIARASALGLDRWVLIELAPGSDVPAAVAAYNADPNVDVAEPDYIFQPLVTPTDPLYPVHWGHNNTAQFRSATNNGVHIGPAVGTVGFDANAETGWTGPNGFGLPNVIIAILDTGVDLTHPDLRVVDGYDTGDLDSDPQEDPAASGHGTACAGVAAARANNGLGACGSAPGCSIMPMKVTNEGFFAFVFIAEAIVWATDHGADVISMSFGFYFPTPEGSAVVNAAIEYADAAGVVMFSGTGNANNPLMLYPASHPNVISVGAASPCSGRKRSSSNPAFVGPGTTPDPNGVSCDNVRWWGSSWGTNVQDAPDAVDILAPTLLPFTDIQGAGGYVPGDYAQYFNGVSCSVPYVAGVAALIKSKHPDWTAAQIRQQLVSTAQDVVNVESVAGWDKYSGYGMVDINAAVGCSATPVIVGNGGITAGAGENCCVTIHPDDLITSVSDPDGDEDIVSVRITKVDDTTLDVDSTLVCGLGSHSVQVTVTDYCGNTSSASVDVNVTDTTPPSITVVMDRNVLWPPNHKMVTCCATVTATDTCDDSLAVVLVSVSSNESDTDRGNGNTVDDIQGAAIGTFDVCFDLRSQRQGSGDGRSYEIVYSATDNAGNMSYDTVTVDCPHDQRAHALASTGFNARGTSLGDANSFTVFLLGSKTLDVANIDRESIYAGNTGGTIAATRSRQMDINHDGLIDLAAFFEHLSPSDLAVIRMDEDPTGHTGAADTRAISHGPIGIHFVSDGVNYLVSNIYGLGAPVEMPVANEKDIVDPHTHAPAATTALRTAITSVHPNPFNPQTTVHFALASATRVQIAIYNVTGALVRRLVDESMGAGEHEARWDGMDDAGQGATSGIYFVRMVAGSYSDVRKIVMLK